MYRRGGHSVLTEFTFAEDNMAKSVMSNSDMLEFVRAIRDGKDLI